MASATPKPQPGFGEIWGQQEAVGRIVEGLRKNRLAPSLVFHGPEGIGKSLLALLLARTLTCPDAREAACGNCPSCRKIQPPDCRHPDIRRLTPQGQEIRIQQIRDLIREIQVRPMEGKRRVFLIDPADRMTSEAANALLKTLEEPPPRSAILLVTSKYHSLLPTVRSRCQMIRLQTVDRDTVYRYLVEAKQREESEADLIATLCEGRIAQAATFEVQDYRKRRDRLLSMISDLQGRRYGSAVIHHSEQLSHNLEELRKDLDILLFLFRDVACLVHLGASAPIANGDIQESLREIAGRFGPRSHNIVERIEETRRDLARNVNRYLAMQVLLFDLAGAGRMAEPRRRPPISPGVRPLLR